MNNLRGGKIRKGIQKYSKSQFVRFVLTGTVNTIVAYAVYALALVLGCVYTVANFIALVTGILISFTTQGKFVFNSLDYSLFWRFLVCWILIFWANVAIIRHLIELRFDPYVAGALALPFITPLSFVVQKYLVFANDDLTLESRPYTKDSNISDFPKRR